MKACFISFLAMLKEYILWHANNTGCLTFNVLIAHILSIFIAHILSIFKGLCGFKSSVFKLLIWD